MVRRGQLAIDTDSKIFAWFAGFSRGTKMDSVPAGLTTLGPRNDGRQNQNALHTTATKGWQRLIRSSFNMDELFKHEPEMQKPNVQGGMIVPRFHFTWQRVVYAQLEKEDVAEVDADAGRLTAPGLADY
jgi:hypothetical protein